MGVGSGLGGGGGQGGCEQRSEVIVKIQQNGALLHLEIRIMMDVYQTVLANTSTSYNEFWLILTSSELKKID